MLGARGFAEWRGVVGNGMKRDAILACGFQAAGNGVSLGITNHEGGEGLLQRIGGAVLLFEGSKRHSLQFGLLAQSTLENSNGVELG